MPGLLAVSWAGGRESSANELFEQISRSYEELTGLPRNSDVRTEGFRVARFAARKSPHPDVFQDLPKQLIVASAGWWYEHDGEMARVLKFDRLTAEYQHAQVRIFDRMAGQYLIAVIDRPRRKLVASVDRLGFFPAYVVEKDGMAWLSTSSTVLAAVLKSPLDVGAVRALFMGNAIRSPQTAFEGIRRLAFGEQVVMADGKAQVERVWLPYRSTSSYRKIGDAAEDGVAILKACCRCIRELFPEALFDLTSGLDTRLIVSGFAEPGAPTNVTVNGDDDHLDVVVARQIAEHFNWTCHRGRKPENWGQIRWPYFQQASVLAEGELAADNVDGVLRFKEKLAEQFDASITGSFAEICRDFFWQQEFLKISKTSYLDIPRLFRYRFFFNSRPNMSLFRSDWRAEYANDQIRMAQQIADLAPDALNTSKLDAIYIWKNSGHGGRYLGTSFVSIPSLIPAGISPFVEFAISLSFRYRRGGGLVRHMITSSHPELAKFPTCYGGSAEPFRVTRPLAYLPYLVNTFKKGVRKAGQLTIKRQIFKDPCDHRVNPNDNTDFVHVLNEQGLLKIDNLVTAGLYHSDGLRGFLSQVNTPTFTSYSQLYSILSLELMCRRIRLTPSGQSL